MHKHACTSCLASDCGKHWIMWNSTFNLTQDWSFSSTQLNIIWFKHFRVGITLIILFHKPKGLSEWLSLYIKIFHHIHHRQILFKNYFKMPDCYCMMDDGWLILKLFIVPHHKKQQLAAVASCWWEIQKKGSYTCYMASLCKNALDWSFSTWMMDFFSIWNLSDATALQGY